MQYKMFWYIYTSLGPYCFLFFFLNMYSLRHVLWSSVSEKLLRRLENRKTIDFEVRETNWV